MKRQRKRIISAWFLLSIFVLTTTLSALHIHQPVSVATECADCAHHVQHHGHLSASTGSMHDCVLCQFLSLPFLPATILTVVLSVSLTVIATNRNVHFVCYEAGKAQSTRAPPYYI